MSENKKNKKFTLTGRAMSLLTAAVIAAAAVCAGIFWIYPMMTDRIIDVSLKNMEELAKHDEQSLEANIKDKWTLLEKIADHVRQSRISTTNDLLFQLSTTRQFINCMRLTLIDEDGYTLSSNMMISTLSLDENILADPEADRYIYCTESRNAAAEGRRELLVAGVKIKPIIVEGHKYTRIAAIMDVDVLKNVTKTDCYDGRGFSRVVDANGRYIVNANRIYTDSSQYEDSFFARIENGRLREGFTVEKIRDKMSRDEAFSIPLDDGNGTSYVLCLVPMDETDWYFIMSVPLNVFKEQSISLLKIFMLMILLLIAAVAVIVFVVLRRRARLLDLEQKHRMEMSDALVLAEQASRAKTTFLNNMSHDIRTPMNAIIGFTALASAHIDNTEKVSDYLSKITQSSNHLLSLINDVLDMSRIESGNINLDEKPESLSEILHTLKNIIQADIHAKQLDFFIDIADITNENIYCDKLRLNQILLNLVSNAIKFTPPGGTVSVRVIQTSVNRGGCATYEFHVKDNGIGMSKEFTACIFEPFTRERSSTISGIQGTGLGMSITKNIVDIMGGTITVDSHENKGTEFTVTLTFRLHEGTKTIGVIKKLEGLRGLVVDDDVNSCQSVSQMLRQIGMRAEWTRYGKEAVVRTAEAVRIGDRYELYIIDWVMPDMNGIETARRIRQAVGDNAPIIILSAYDWADVEEEAKEAGVTEFISKPIFPSELHELLLKVTGEHIEVKKEPKADILDSIKSKALLLAEDNELNREIATELLEDEGFTVEYAENGQIAVDMIKAAKPGYYGAVLMDIQMPVMDGYEASREIRRLSDPGLAGIPIIAMTANAFEQDRQTALEAGMNAHVSKPINVAELMETIKNVVK